MIGTTICLRDPSILYVVGEYHYKIMCLIVNTVIHTTASK